MHSSTDLRLGSWAPLAAALRAHLGGAPRRRLHGAQQRNFARWPVMGTRMWIDYYVFASYGEHVAFLRQYLDERMAWLDRAFASTAAFDSLCR